MTSFYLQHPTFTYIDPVTKLETIFSAPDSNGGIGVYTRYIIPNYTNAIPINVGTIQDGIPFTSINQSVTYTGEPSVFITGGIRWIVGNLPPGISYVDLGTDLLFSGNPETNAELIINIDDCTEENYPVNLILNKGVRWYFKVRAESKNFPDTIFGEWLYYFTLRINWSDIRDTFITNIKGQRFSLNQTDILTNIDYLNTMKEQGYFS